MKTIKSQADIEALVNELSTPDKLIAHISDYFKRLMGVYGNDYDPQESGFIILLEEGDPLTDITFLDEELGIRGGQSLESIIKEFVDYDAESNHFDVLIIFNADFALSYIIPNESWVGSELRWQLQTFQNYQGNNSGQKASIFN